VGGGVWEGAVSSKLQRSVCHAPLSLTLHRDPATHTNTTQRNTTPLQLADYFIRWWTRDE